MKPLIELLNLIVSTVEENCDLDTEISVEELSAEGGLYVEYGEGVINKTYYDKTTERTIPVIFQCRHSSHERGMEQLCSISDYLQKLKQYPQGQTFTWLDTTVEKETRKTGREESGMFNFTCILNCKVHY